MDTGIDVEIIIKSISVRQQSVIVCMGSAGNLIACVSEALGSLAGAFYSAFKARISPPSPSRISSH